MDNLICMSLKSVNSEARILLSKITKVQYLEVEGHLGSQTAVGAGIVFKIIDPLLYLTISTSHNDKRSLDNYFSIIVPIVGV